jgi:hypothetical protein
MPAVTDGSHLPYRRRGMPAPHPLPLSRCQGVGEVEFLESEMEEAHHLAVLLNGEQPRILERRLDVGRRTGHTGNRGVEVVQSSFNDAQFHLACQRIQDFVPPWPQPLPPVRVRQSAVPHIRGTLPVEVGTRGGQWRIVFARFEHLGDIAADECAQRSGPCRILQACGKEIPLLRWGEG